MKRTALPLTLTLLLLAVPGTPGAEPTAAEAAGAPAAFTQLVSALADHLHTIGIRRLAVLEFADGSVKPVRLGGAIGAAGKFFADVTQGIFTEYAKTKYDVVEPERTQHVLKKLSFTLDSLEDEELLRRFDALEPVDVIITGTLKRQGDTISVLLRGIGVPEAVNRALENGAVPLSSDLAALFGESFYRPPSTDGQGATESELVQLVSAAEEAHPLADSFSGVPYALELIVDDAPLPLHNDGEKVFVPAALGKTYRIRLTNKDQRAVAVGLYVDGLNTIGQKRTAPSKGLKWVLNPGQSAEVKGWQMGTEVAREFLFTPAAESLAARKNFTDDIGLITAVFFREKTVEAATETTRGAVGTGEGKEVQSRIRRVKMEYDQTPAAVLNLHYDLPEVVAKFDKVE